MPDPDSQANPPAQSGKTASRDIDAIDRKLAVLETRLMARSAPDPDDDLRSVVDCIAEPAIVLSNGRIVFANAAAAKSHDAGHRDRLIGLAQSEIVHPDDKSVLDARIVEACRAGGRVAFGALRGIALSGEAFRETLRMTSVTWSGAPAVLMICRKYASTETRSVGLVADDLAPPALEGVNSGVWEWSPGNDGVYLGPRLKEILALGSVTRGRRFVRWQDIVHPEDLEPLQQRLQDHVAGQSAVLDIEARLRRGDGDHQWTRLMGKALRDNEGEVSRVAGTASDISRLKVTEAELEARTSETEQAKALLDSGMYRIAQLESELGKAKRAVNLAEHNRTEYVANMSHELRTPLNAIMGFAEIIRDEMLGPVGVARYRDYADDILSSASHLLGVVNDILDLSSLESGDVELAEERLNVRRLVVAAVRLVRDRAEEADLTVKIQASRNLPALTGDGLIVKRMMLHLLSNALKFSPPGGSIGVATFVGEDGGIRIRIRDQGAGIPKDALAQALRPFGKAGNPSASTKGGIGLGLPTVRAQIELHGGRLELHSGRGRGTTATLCFPPERTVSS